MQGAAQGARHSSYTMAYSFNNSTELQQWHNNNSKVLAKDESKENKVVEIKLNGPKNQFFSKERARSFEAGVDAAVEALRRQLKKHKEKVAAY